jgi:hypothetical protein
MIWNAQYGPLRKRIYRRTGGKNMKQRMTRTLPLVTLLVILAVGIAAVPLTSGVSVFGLGIVPAALAAAALVAYFGWRANLRRRILAEAEDYRRAA